MKRSRRLHSRLVREISLCLSLALTVVLLGTPFAQVSGNPNFLPQRRNDPRNDKARRVDPPRPERGAPALDLPNLDEAKRQPRVNHEAPLPIPSTIRSRRKPLESRNDRRVGDPRTTGEVWRIEKKRPENSARSLKTKLFHHSRARGKFSDEALDRAARNIMSADELAADNTLRRDKKRFRNGMSAHSLIKRNCRSTNPNGPPPRR